MKTLPLVAVFFLALVVAVQAAPPPGWTVDYSQAVEKAKSENKMLLLNFCGSDWCGYCMSLEKEVLNTPKFKAWANQNYVLVQVDFPNSKPQSPKVKAQNAGLKDKFHINTYPTLLFVDADGKGHGRKVGYGGGGPDVYITALESALKK